MRVFLKAGLIFLCIIIFILALSGLRIIFIFSRSRRSYCASNMLRVFNKILVKILGIKVTLCGEKQEFKDKGVFFVSNHLSYLDGFITSSIFPFIFIGKSELKSWPLLGAMIYLSDTVFVNRANHSNIQREIEKIKLLLKNKINVILFPEGTSCDGKVQLPFKSSFFAAPLELGCKIVPLAIKYERINGQGINEDNKDLVYWYGEMEFFPHLMRVLSLKSIEVQVKIGGQLEVTGDADRSASFNRKYLSSVSQEAVNRRLSQEA